MNHNKITKNLKINYLINKIMHIILKILVIKRKVEINNILHDKIKISKMEKSCKQIVLIKRKKMKYNKNQIFLIVDYFYFK